MMYQSNSTFPWLSLVMNPLYGYCHHLHIISAMGISLYTKREWSPVLIYFNVDANNKVNMDSFDGS